MSRKRGKNRPPKLSPNLSRAPTVAVRPCDGCHQFVPLDKLEVIDGGYAFGTQHVCPPCRTTWRRFHGQETY